MSITYYTKQVYGYNLLYLASQIDAYNWRQLTGKKTLTANDMHYFTELTGIQFERVFEPVEAIR